MTGRWSGQYGRKPTYVRSRRTSARNGNTPTACAASRRMTGTEYVRSNPTRSREAPIRIVPDLVPSMTTEVWRSAALEATLATYSAV